MSIENTNARPARWLRWTLGAAAALVVASGCVTVDDKGDDDGSGSGAGGAPSGSGSGAGSGTASGGGSFECCLPSGNYACPNEAAFDACVGFDMDGCMEACAFDDFMCHDECFDQLMNATNDPSGCVADASVDCEGGGPGPASSSSSGGSTSSTGGPQCSDILSGCDYDDDCCSDNCTNSTCYGNDFGSPCDYDDDCDSTNCFEGSCQ
jgi:hypothetical protein